MFSRVATLLPLAALVAAVSAAPNVLEARTNGGCSTGANYCCDQALQSTQQFTGLLGGLLTVVAQAGVPVGLTCTPISVIAIAGNSCTQQCASCENTFQNGLVNIACTPINANL